MSPDERERLNALCEQIAKETDQHEFLKLLQELDALLERNRPCGHGDKVISH